MTQVVARGEGRGAPRGAGRDTARRAGLGPPRRAVQGEAPVMGQVQCGGRRDDSDSVISLSLPPYIGVENVECELVPDKQQMSETE